MNSEISSPIASAPPVAPDGLSRSRKARWPLIGALALGLAGVIALVVHFKAGKEDAKDTAPTSDAPRVQGELISYSNAFAERAGIKVAEATRSKLVPVVNAVGTVDFDPAHVAAVGTRLRGMVSRVSMFEGDHVEPGSLLAVIESAELGEAQASVSMLAAEKKAADINLQREQSLSERKLSTLREAELAGVEAQKYQLLLGAARQKVQALSGGGAGKRSGRLGAYELLSPIKGTIVERSIAPGQSVEGQLVAFRIANVDHLWVELDVFEKNLAKVRVNDRVELIPLANPGEVFEGRVARVGAQIDPDTRSAPLRVEVDNRDRRLRSGQAVNAKIHASGGSQQEAVLIPSSAVTFVDGKPTLFVQKEPTAVRVAKVELGQTNGQQTEVLTGLNPGDRVVVDGVFALKSELFR